MEAQLAGRSSSSSDGGAAAAAVEEEQPPQSQQQQLVTGADLSSALLAMVATLPDLVEDVPISPLLVAELAGHFLAAGQLSFTLAEFAAAVREAGAEDAAEEPKASKGEDGGDQEEEDAEAQEPPLIDAEKALPMLLVVANAIKVGVALVCVLASAA